MASDSRWLPLRARRKLAEYITGAFQRPCFIVRRFTQFRFEPAMAVYNPTSRRPIAQIFRRTAEAATAACVRLGVSPNTISILSIVSATIAANCLWKSAAYPWLLVAGPLFFYLRLWLNMLDGMVAIASGKASLAGEIANDLPDRISDVIIFAGVAHSGWMHPLIGYWTAILALLTAYVGLFGQALGQRRQFGGMMSKPWRMVLLSIGCWITFLAGSLGQPSGRWTVLDCTCAMIIAGCVQTIWVRLQRLLISLGSGSR